MRSASFIGHADSRVLGTTTNQRRYTYDKDLLWILDHLSQHGKILKLKLGFCGRRKVRMSTRDKDFLIALKGVKTDKLEIGNPTCDGEGKFDVRFSQSMFPLSIQFFFFHSGKPCRINANSEFLTETYP